MMFQLLTPQTITNVISQQAAVSSWLLNLFGVNHGTPNADPLFDPDTDIVRGQNVLYFGHGRTGSYNVMDNTRRIAQGTAPGSPAAQGALQNVGQVPFAYPRMHDSISLLAETFHNLGQLSNPAERDAMGQQMIGYQTQVLAQLAANWRKAALVGALRSTLKAKIAGSKYDWDFASGASVSNQLPAGNKSRLNMLGEGNIIGATWATDTTPINTHLDGINRAFQRLGGGALRAVIMPTNVYSAMADNEQLRNFAGWANPVLESLTVEANGRGAITMKNVKRVKLKSQPIVDFYVTDEVLEMSDGTLQQIVPNNYAIFLGEDPDSGNVAMYEGSEPIAEFDGGPESLRVGFSSWMVKRSDPTETRVYVLDNAMPVIHRPNLIAYGEVIF